MYAFYSYEGDFTEGFLGNPKDFNGIVFLLKEPNDPEGAKTFWFKEIENNFDGYFIRSKEDADKITKEKRVASKFINRFTELLEIVGLGSREDLGNAVFCNINPQGGGCTAGEIYKQKLETVPPVMLPYLATLRKEITIFTCTEIYERLKKLSVFENQITEDGIEYKGGKLKCTRGEVNGTKVCVYAIYHPSARKTLIVK